MADGAPTLALRPGGQHAADGCVAVRGRGGEELYQGLGVIGIEAGVEIGTEGKTEIRGGLEKAI